MPQRIQWTRWQGMPLPPNTVNVQRPSRWGNPYPVRTYGRAEALRLFAAWLRALSEPERERYLAPLRGQDLACACAVYDKEGLRVPCHGDIWLSLANNMPMEEICVPCARTSRTKAG
jgi:Domain of unknown function (DUF4326)